MEDDDKFYWSLMDVCINVEEGVEGHVAAVDKIISLVDSYISTLKIKEQRPL